MATTLGPKTRAHAIRRLERYSAMQDDASGKWDPWDETIRARVEAIALDHDVCPFCSGAGGEGSRDTAAGEECEACEGNGKYV